jgi:hypothetical protein
VYYILSNITIHLLTELYSKQANQKMLQKGKAHPNRNAQFEHINKVAEEFLEKGEPAISVDTKKKKKTSAISRTEAKNTARKANHERYLTMISPSKSWAKLLPTEFIMSITT